MLEESYVQPMDSTAEPIDIRRIRVGQYKGTVSRFKTLLRFLGPAFIVSVAYIDPGNFATNISGGSIFNYDLVWVILWSNLMAIFLQSLSAKLGIATGCNLPQMCGKVFSRKVNWFLWIIAELGAMATDLAEFIGGTLGFYLLFHIPMAYAGIITAVLTFIIVYISKYGQRAVEAVITILVAVICLSYTLELFLAKPDWSAAGLHLLLPSIPNGKAVMIAVGMLGATVMPHVIFLHSQLVQHRNKDLTIESKRKHYRMEKMDITIAMNIAFIVNAAMVIVSAAVFFRNGMAVTSIEQAQKSLSPLLGAASSGAFAIALIASGLSSSAVGTMAGQTIMQGFVGLKISDNITRLITMFPGMLIILLSNNPMQVLVLSQVTLSFILPFAIIPLLLITRRKDLMGVFANKPAINVIGWIIAGLIIAANIILLTMTFTGQV
ncbi:MAG TPA: Nramp family divalent metal transporter [Mobilitalea sp.]|nr:Nramp family divalent metal transporter [Mobilitalea sp.]